MNTRIAPSPTGNFHVGSARTAYHNWLVARATGGSFILRIDDTDAERSNPLYTKNIIDSLEWLNIDYDKIYYQSERLEIYRKYADRLKEDGLAYSTENGAILFSPKTWVDSWDDTIAGEIQVNDRDREIISGMPLMKSDGMPTYNFASVVDDIELGVDTIMRGTDHINNTSKQVNLLLAIGGISLLQKFKFTHIGLIHFKSRRLSKREGANSVFDYRDAGILPEALLNFILRMGWSPSDPQFDSKFPLVNQEQAISMILTAGKFNSSDSNFDEGKLAWYNKKYKGIARLRASI